MSEHKPTKNILSWGYFQYDPNKKLVIRDNRSVEVVLPDDQAAILNYLLRNPNLRVPYPNLIELLNLGRYEASIYNFQPLLQKLRLTIGDINFGADTRDERYSLWRYINHWMDRPDGNLRSSAGLSGVILLNRNTTEVQEFYRRNPPHHLNANKVRVIY